MAWRKHETEQDQSEKSLEDFEARFLRSSPVEKEQTIRACQRLVEWMNAVAVEERGQARDKLNGVL